MNQRLNGIEILDRASAVRTRMADLYRRGCPLCSPDFVALSQELDAILLPMWHRLKGKHAEGPVRPREIEVPRSAAAQVAEFEQIALHHAANARNDRALDDHRTPDVAI